MTSTQIIVIPGSNSGDLLPQQLAVFELIRQGKSGSEMLEAMGFLSPAPLEAILKKLAQKGLIEIQQINQQETR